MFGIYLYVSSTVVFSTFFYLHFNFSLSFTIYFIACFVIFGHFSRLYKHNCIYIYILLFYFPDFNLIDSCTRQHFSFSCSLSLYLFSHLQ